MQLTKRKPEEHRTRHHIFIPSGRHYLEDEVTIPEGAESIVIFAHGSGSGRFSPRNKFVADILNDHHLGTLLIDLLTAEEEEIDRYTRHLRFDIPMLAKRLEDIALWLKNKSEFPGYRIGFFGSSTGGGAALIAAAHMQDDIKAVVSRGGRPDLAGEALLNVKAPTLLIVGGNDSDVLRLNRHALESLNVSSALKVIDGASHLFEEPGTLALAAHSAGEWFKHHMEKQNHAHKV